MQRILVIGSPGSGKSTFSRRLSEVTQIPVTHLDNLFWRKDRTFVEHDEFMRRIEELVAQERWIIDGNYGSSMPLRMQYSDTVIFLDYDLETCLEGIKSRVGRSRSDLPWFEADLDPDFYEYVRRFPEEQRPDILVRLAEHPEQTIVTLKNRDEGEVYLRELITRSPWGVQRN